MGCRGFSLLYAQVEMRRGVPVWRLATGAQGPVWPVMKVEKCAKCPKFYLFWLILVDLGGCDTQFGLHRTVCGA